MSSRKSLGIYPTILIHSSLLQPCAPCMNSSACKNGREWWPVSRLPSPTGWEWSQGQGSYTTGEVTACNQTLTHLFHLPSFPRMRKWFGCHVSLHQHREKAHARSVHSIIHVLHKSAVPFLIRQTKPGAKLGLRHPKFLPRWTFY